MRTDMTGCKRNGAAARGGFVASSATALLALGLCVGCENPAAPVPPEFEIVDLAEYAPCDDARYGCRSDAYDVNDAGQVIGIFPDTTGWDVYAFVWQSGSVQAIGRWGAAIDINNAGQVVGNDGLWEDGEWSALGDVRATAINDRGDIVGAAFYAAGETEWGDTLYESHATLLSGGVMTDLGTLGGTWSVASAVNNSVQVVGWSATAPSTPGAIEQVHAFLWEDGVMIDLGDLDGGTSYALDINNLGQVVGWFTVGGEWDLTSGSGFLWEDGLLTELEALGGETAHALGVNDLGDIVGGSATATGAYHAALWRDGAIVDLGTLNGFAVSQAYAINDAGTIVGYSEAPGNRRATMWRRN